MAGEAYVRRVLLGSGGMDTLCHYHLLNEPDLLHIDVGHSYEAVERRAMDLLYPSKKQKRIYNHSLAQRQHPDGFIPMRNMFFGVVAAAEGYDTIYLGALRGESSPDKGRWFLFWLSHLMSYTSKKKIEIVAPFRHLTKSQLLHRYLNHGGEVDLVRMTRSCYNLTDYYDADCGRCMACYRRWVALTLNGIEGNFDQDPSEWDGAEISIENAAKGIGYLAGTSPLEWPGILASNLEARSALKRKPG